MKDKYTVVVTADIHMNNKMAYSKPVGNGLTNRFKDQLEFWRGMDVICHRVGADAVFVLGDLFDKALVDAVTLTHTIEAIVKLPCDVYLLPGNHDASSVTGGRYVVEAFNAMEKKGVYYLGASEHPVYFPIGDATEWLRFYPVPYSSLEIAQKQIQEYQTLMTKMPPGQDILLMHQSVIGCIHMGWECDQGLDAEMICEGFDRIWSGHFHRTQWFGPDQNGLYVGAPMHHDFSDVDRETYVWAMTLTPDSIVMEPIDLAVTPRFHVTKFDLKEHTWSGRDVVEGKHKHGDYWRTEVKATHEQWNEFKTRLPERIADLEKEGIHASFKHKLIREHTERLVDDEKEESIITLEGQIKKYVDMAWTGDKKVKGAVLECGLNLLKEAKDAL